METARQATCGFKAAMKESLQSETVISIRGLTKCYSDNTVANKGIDLDVYEGRVLSILGPNARRDVWNLVNEVKRWGRTVI
jgi:ABC-type sugar transport system ATPase subunit